MSRDTVARVRRSFGVCLALVFLWSDPAALAAPSDADRAGHDGHVGQGGAADGSGCCEQPECDCGCAATQGTSSRLVSTDRVVAASPQEIAFKSDLHPVRVLGAPFRPPA